MNPHDRCQGCDTMRKDHASLLSSCVRFIEPGECCCLFAQTTGQHLHQRCPFNAAYVSRKRVEEEVMSEIIQRYEDMSRKGKLEMLRQPDGDMILIVWPDPEGMQHAYSSVEFCTCWAGGGQSPKVLEALYRLYEAIQLDNKERPQKRD